MATLGNPLSVLSPGSKTKPTRLHAAGKIGNWTIYRVKQGGMGEVYICGAGDASAEFALKSFQPRLFFDPESRRAFLREITIWLRLTGSPFIMPALRIEQHGSRLFVLMPAIGEDSRHVGTVGDLIERKVASPVEAFTVAWQFALGMKLAGDAIPGVSHGDLKPANLLYNGGPVLISDFGLASIGRRQGAPLRATPGYEAPEYVDTGATPAADVYSFGVILSALAASCSGPKTAFSFWKKASGPASLIRVLAETAEICRVRDPEARPSFGDVVRNLGEWVVKRPEELRDMFVATGSLHAGFRDMQASMLPEVAESLLKIDAPAQALEVLDSLKEEGRSTRVLVLRGTSLSLLERDGEAIAWFERALKGQLEGDERLNCLSEYALSLKRVGRLEEATNVYKGLLGTAADSRLGQVVVNLASVYAEAAEHQKAVNLLERFLRTHQEVPLAFAALGNAYAGLGRYKEAASQYQRAIALAPQLAHLQVAFADICLRQLGRWDDAYSALFAAHQQGFMSREWLLLTLASSTLTGRKGDVDELMKAAERDLPSVDVQRLEKEVMEMTIAAMRKAVGQEGSTENATQPEPKKKPALPMELAAQSNAPDPASVVKDSTGSAGASFEPAGLPFFNVRFYMPENRFSFDYYNDIRAVDYVDKFLESWNRFQRDPNLTPNAELRPKPLYFHLCPICKTYILTNREEGSNLNCRQCNVKNPTRRVEDEGTLQILSAAHKVLSKTLKSHKGLRQFLLFQPVDDNPQVLDEMKRTCREAGFEHFAGANSTLGSFCMWSLEKSGLTLDRRREIITVSSLSISDELSYAGETPAETDVLVGKLRMLAPIRSMSTNYDPAANDLVSLFFGGNIEEMERECRRAVAESPENIVQLRLLVEILRGNKKNAEAKALSWRATVSAPDNPDSWIALGETEKDLEEYPAAISHLNKALSLDPLRRDALIGLFLCYEKTGEKEESQEIWSRIESLGGSMLST
jgi:tetratricopeptide (TPR) repeat protein